MIQQSMLYNTTSGSNTNKLNDIQYNLESKLAQENYFKREVNLIWYQFKFNWVNLKEILIFLFRFGVSWETHFAVLKLVLDGGDSSSGFRNQWSQISTA